MIYLSVQITIKVGLKKQIMLRQNISMLFNTAADVRAKRAHRCLS